MTRGFSTPMVDKGMDFCGRARKVGVGPAPTINMVNMRSVRGVEALSFGGRKSGVVLVNGACSRLTNSRCRETVRGVRGKVTPGVEVSRRFTGNGAILSLVDGSGSGGVATMRSISTNKLTITLSRVIVGSKLNTGIALGSSRLSGVSLLFSRDRTECVLAMGTSTISSVLSRVSISTRMVNRIRNGSLFVGDRRFGFRSLSSTCRNIVRRFVTWVALKKIWRIFVWVKVFGGYCWVDY